jgi:aryl-alcohol dehydrogenase-like predicted oxidoreductase
MSTHSDPFLSRRDALRSGLLAGAGLMLGGAAEAALGAAGSSGPLMKPIPSTAEKLPVVGLGTDKFRSGENDAIRAEIQRMQQLGGAVIDTAAAYGDSEELIGEAVAALGIRDRLFIATKLTARSRFGFGPDGKESFERSLERLKTQRIDLLQVHNLSGVDTLMPLLKEWKQAGKIRYLGITTSSNSQHAAMVEYMRKYPIDFVQVDYSLANRDAASNVLPVAQERKIAVLANIPFGFGSVLHQAQTRPLPPWVADIDVKSWSQLLLKYVISHPAVTCTIPGSTQVAHLEENQAAARGRMPDEAQRRKLEQLWDAA